MKPTLLSFYIHDTGDKARLQLQQANDFAHLELPASIHAPLRRLLADALVEMGRELADAVSPASEARFGMTVTREGVAKINHAPAPLVEYVWTYAECPSYLTPGKRYRFTPDLKDGGTVTDDEGDTTYINLVSCLHIDGAEWKLERHPDRGPSFMPNTISAATDLGGPFNPNKRTAE